MGKDGRIRDLRRRLLPADTFFLVALSGDYQAGVQTLADRARFRMQLIERAWPCNPQTGVSEDCTAHRLLA